jgi:hypothetical protein
MFGMSRLTALPADGNVVLFPICNARTALRWILASSQKAGAPRALAVRGCNLPGDVILNGLVSYIQGLVK